ncbi:MAG: hypothetical protein KGV51_08355 [Moraxellaceae bacterium]|nr:hypothetical protein [Moraxellaceae bacterium]
MYNETDVLLGYQKRWVDDKSQLKIAEKSRRTGLTWAEASDNALTASLTKADGGCDVFYIGSNKEMAREYIDAVAMWSKMFNYACDDICEEVIKDEDKDILTFVIYFASGFKVKALSSNPKNLRGMQGTVVIDEAGFHERLAEVLKASLALTMWGAKVRIISTHNGVDNLFNELITDSRAGKKRYSVHTITLDDACKDGLYKRICQVTKQTWSQEKEDKWKADLLNDTASEEDALEEYYCVPKNGSGNWLTRAMIEKNMSKDTPIISLIKDDDFTLVKEPQRRAEIHDWCEEELKPILDKLDPSLKHYLGEDFARSSNLTSISVGAEQPNLDLDVQFIVELGKIPYEQQKQIVLYIIEHLPNFSGGAFDARGNGDFLAESVADEYGEWNEESQTGLIDKVMFSDKWYREHTAPFKSALEDGTFKKIPKNTDVLADLRSFRVVKGVPKIPTTTSKKDEKGIIKHADTAISLLLLRHAQYTIDATAVEIGLMTEQDNNSTYNQYEYGQHSVTMDITRGY